MMEILNKRSRSKLIAALGSAVWMLCIGSPALADDIEIFFGQANNLTNNNPNVLLIIDSSSSMSAGVPGDPLGRDRLKVVQDVAVELVSNMSDVNVGVMRFDYYGYRSSYNEWDSQGGMVTHPISDVSDNLSTLTNRINEIHHHGWTPLSETYYEAAAYYMGLPIEYGLDTHEGYVNAYGYNADRPRYSHPDTRTGGSYDSPITGACQRNYIIYLSDGEPTQDTTAEYEIESLLTDSNYGGQLATQCNNDHGSVHGMCIDELAEFLYENDFSSEPGQQNVISHFIGFNIDLPIFADAAEKGGGDYYTANNADDLRRKLVTLLETVADTDDGFTAPAVTVNAFDRTSHLDELYFTVFKPGDTDRWDGNLKKYKFLPKSSGDGLEVVGQNGEPAVDEVTGFFYNGRDLTGAPDPNVPTAWSYWSDSPDGAEVTTGGSVGEISFPRKIYTNNGGGESLSLLNNSSAFEGYLQDIWDLSGGNNNSHHHYSAEEWFDWATGIDVADADEDGETDDVRQQMGAPLHSKPAVVTYGGTNDNPDTTLFVGTNDGYLHAIDGQTGEEHWSFLPHEMWKNIPTLAENKPKSGDLSYGIDGHISVRRGVDDNGANFVHLIFGLRRGGNHYYLMDVTNLNSPQLINVIDVSEGQSWSRPVFAKVNLGTDSSPDPRDVILIGGGYDPDQDNHNSYHDDDQGNSIHMLDAETGNEIWKASNDASANLTIPEMTSSIPSAIRALDLNLDGFVDRMYVNDLGGRLFRFDIHNEDTSTSDRITAGVIASVGGAETNSTSNNRRFYYAPDIALGSENGVQFLTITMASGFRANPLGTSNNDYLLGVRDYNAFTKLGEDSDDYDYDVTIASMQDLGSGSTVTISPGANGWYRGMGNGEKSLAASRIFQNKAYFTTYTPGSAPASNPCAPAVGSGKLVTIDLTSGAIVENVLQKPGIPPEVTFLFGESTGGEDQFTCFGNGCSHPPTDPNDPDTPEPDGSSERQIECLAGPESCEADGTEVPQRTFWRQTSVD